MYRTALPLRLRAPALVLALLATVSTGRAASVAPVAAENGMVVTAQHLATQVGVEVLRRGGNAVDAAVAVGYALAVVYPAAGNLGGGGFMTLQFAEGRKTFVDFREKAPLAARADMFQDKDGQLIPGLSTASQLAVGVPGTVAGLEYARTRYGTRPRAALVAPAITLAEHGFALDQGDIDMFRRSTADFRKDPASAAIFLRRDGNAYAVGDRLVQRDLARTLRTIAVRGPAGFYQGRVGAALAAFNQQGGGLITQADLDQYGARELPPAECSYRGYQVVSAPPPSSGGTTLCEILNIVEGYPLKDQGYGAAQGVHWQIEAMRHAYADRNHFLGDPDFVQNPVARLTDKAYAAQVRGTIADTKAGVSRDIAPGESPHEGSNTTHYSIVDRWGNAAAVTYTLNNWFGNRTTVPGTGVLLNNEMDDFTTKVGVGNLYGLVQGEANAIAPGKRPLSSMSPTIVSRDGQPVLVLGTPGGSRIITAVAQVILNMVDYGMNVQEAVDAPRFHQQWLPDLTYVEPYALSPDTRRLLESWGQHFGQRQPANHVAAIAIGAPTLGGKPVGANRFYGANDPRRNTGLALGY